MTIRQLSDAIDGLDEVMSFVKTDLFLYEGNVDPLRAIYILGRLVEASRHVLAANEGLTGEQRQRGVDLER